MHSLGDPVYLYLILKWLHVLAAIAVVGLHGVYGVWIVRAYGHTKALPFTLRTVKLLDDRVALPGFAILLLSGVAMVARTKLAASTPWLLSGLLLFAVLTLVHFLVYRPALRQLILFAERNDLGTPEFQTAVNRERNVGIAMVVALLLIAFLMVVKPRLWG